MGQRQRRLTAAMTRLTATPPGLRLGTRRRRRRRRSHGHHNNRPDRTTITPAAISSSSSSSSQSPILLPLSSGLDGLVWLSQVRITAATITTSFVVSAVVVVVDCSLSRGTAAERIMHARRRTRSCRSSTFRPIHT